MKISQELEQEFENFMDWPGDRKDYVSSYSAKLFAQHWADKQEESAWTEVKKDDPSTLPPYDTPVLIINGDIQSEAVLNCTPDFYPGESENRFGCLDGELFLSPEEVSHWRPLPQPPSEVKK